VSHALEHARGLGAAPLIEIGVAAGEGRAIWDEPCESWIVLPPGVSPREHRYVAVRVIGESMLPLLRPADIALVDLDRAPSTGAVVVAQVDDEDGSKRYVVKCLSQVTDSTLVLRSLNPAYGQVVVPRESNRLLGTVVLRWRTNDEGAG
jgi:phage repressor protein C with HTH and peptisase S24 domain